MTTFLVVGFLALHGLLHLAVWLPKPAPDPAHPPPFDPDHSEVLTAVHVPLQAVRSLLERMPGHADVAVILNPQLTPVEFVLTICEELGIFGALLVVIVVVAGWRENLPPGGTHAEHR